MRWGRLDELYRVVIVDDEMISRGYMELFIKPSKRYEIAAVLPYAQDVLAWCEENPLPHLIIMDVMMAQGIDGLTAAEKIKQEHPSVKIMIATSMADADWLDKAREAGIESFWFKASSDISLLEVMDRTMAGEFVYPQNAPAVQLGNLAASDLSKQQRSLMRLLMEGLSNREIAKELNLSSNTVNDYIDDLMERSGIHSRTALAAQASRVGIVVSDADRVKG